MRNQAAVKRWVGLLIILAVMLACNMPGGSTGGTDLEATRGALELESTKMALEFEQTALSVQITQAANQPTQPPPAPPAAPAAATSAPAEQATYTPYPTYTAPPEQPTELPAPTEVDMKAKIKAANVLVFEDIKGYPALLPYVSRAVDNMGFSGGKVMNVGDAVGNFMQALNSPVKWDLIVVSAEARQGVRGEFWDVLTDQVNNDVALVAEIWYLDQIANGRISSLLGKCGVDLFRDWARDPNKYNELDYSLYWLDSQHELFSSPNLVAPLYTPNIYWMGDAGDLMKIGPGGDAQLLAGLHPKEKSTHGVIATCLGGRVVFQTFSTHDYRQSQVVPLWENYMTYALTNHFKVVP